MSWLKVQVLECDICGERWQGRPSRPRASVVSRARTVGGWHTNSHGVLIVCRGCIDSDQCGRRFPSPVEHAAHLAAHDIPNAILLAELVDEARGHGRRVQISRAGGFNRESGPD